MFRKPSSKDKDKKVKSSKSSHTKNNKHSEKKEPDNIISSQNLQIAKKSLDDIAKNISVFSSAENDAITNLVIPNLDEYKIIGKVFNEYKIDRFIVGIENISALANASNKTLEELCKIDFNVTTEAISNNQSKQFPIDTLEETTLKVLESLNAWATENKNDKFAQSITNFVENEEKLIKGKLEALKFISRAHPEFAKPIYISEKMNPLVTMLNEYIKTAMANKQVHTNEFYETLSRTLKPIEPSFQYLQQANKDLQEAKYNIVLKNSHTIVLELKNSLTNTEINVAKPDDLTDLNQKLAAVLAHNTHKIVTALVSAGELMHRDILNHPRYSDMENDIKTLEGHYKKLKFITEQREKNLNAKQSQTLLPPVTKQTENTTNKENLNSNHTVKVKT